MNSRKAIIKRKQEKLISKQTPEDQTEGSLRNVKRTVTEWIHEFRERQKVNSRTEFKKLFRLEADA